MQISSKKKNNTLDFLCFLQYIIFCAELGASATKLQYVNQWTYHFWLELKSHRSWITMLLCLCFLDTHAHTFVSKFFIKCCVSVSKLWLLFGYRPFTPFLNGEEFFSNPHSSLCCVPCTHIHTHIHVCTCKLVLSRAYKEEVSCICMQRSQFGL